MHPYDDPFPPDGQDGTREPAAAQAAGGDGYRPGPLEALAGAFRLLVTGPKPRALQAGRLAPGLPDRLVPLDELTVLLLHPSVSTAARNKVWAWRRCGRACPRRRGQVVGRRRRASGGGGQATGGNLPVRSTARYLIAAPAAEAAGGAAQTTAPSVLGRPGQVRVIAVVS